MTTGRIWISRLLLALWLAAACPALAAAQTASKPLDRLMTRLAAVDKVDTTYRERRYSSLFARPLERTGRIIYRAPDYFHKELDGDQAMDLTIRSREVTVRSGGDEHHFSLGDQPALALFANALFGALRGDRQALERQFKVGFSGTLDDWTLSLKPRQSAVDAAQQDGAGGNFIVDGRPFEVLTIKGTDARFKRMEIRQSETDRTVLLFQEPQ